MSSDLLEKTQQQLAESFANYKRQLAEKAMNSVFPRGWPSDYKEACRWKVKGTSVCLYYHDLCLAVCQIPEKLRKQKAS